MACVCSPTHCVNYSEAPGSPAAATVLLHPCVRQTLKRNTFSYEANGAKRGQVGNAEITSAARQGSRLIFRWPRPHGDVIQQITLSCPAYGIYPTGSRLEVFPAVASEYSTSHASKDHVLEDVMYRPHSGVSLMKNQSSSSLHLVRTR